MIKLIDNIGDVYAEGNSIDEIIEELNRTEEFRYYYRPKCGIVNAYFDNAENDECGGWADESYKVIED